VAHHAAWAEPQLDERQGRSGKVTNIGGYGGISEFTSALTEAGEVEPEDRIPGVRKSPCQARHRVEIFGAREAVSQQNAPFGALVGTMKHAAEFRTG
jgi:hypothetical protein